MRKLRTWASAIAALLITSTIAWAVSTQVSNLSASGAIAGANLLYVVQTAGSGGVKATFTQVATFINSLFSGDCTATSGGALTCTKTSGVAFTALATTAPGTGVATAAAANLSAAGGLTSTIASGTAALGTSSIASGACATVVTVAGANIATTDTLLASFNGDPTAVTGYIPSTAGMLTIIGYPTSGNANFKACNNTAGAIVPGAITLNWRVVR
jgi:hypothetical protein